MNTQRPTIEIDPFRAAQKPLLSEKTTKRRPRAALDKVRISFCRGEQPYMAVRTPFFPGFNPLNLGADFDAKQGKIFGPNENFAIRFDPIKSSLVLKATPEPIEGEVNASVLRSRGQGRGYFFCHILCGPDQPWQFYCTDPDAKRISHDWKMSEQYGCLYFTLLGLVKVQGFEQEKISGARDTAGTGIGVL